MFCVSIFYFAAAPRRPSHRSPLSPTPHGYGSPQSYKKRLMPSAHMIKYPIAITLLQYCFVCPNLYFLLRTPV